MATVRGSITNAYYVDGKAMSTNEFAAHISRNMNSESSRASAQQQAQDRLKQLQDTWKLGFDQRQQEAETNASRAFKYRDAESQRDFGQNRTLQKDTLDSAERRDNAQIAARERMQNAGFGQERDMAGLRSQIKQREKSEDRAAAIASFRGRR